MNKIIKNKIYITLDYLYDELDKSYIIKDNLDYETQFGELICNETRLKLLKDFICVFKMFRKKSNGNVLKLLNTATNRIRLHIYQLKRSECNKHVLEDNRMYFTSLLRVAYSLYTI
tara:strand:+ start:80 stop:427 length:348 start_codon:yes stop_codon:yes gene_type:complete